MNVQRPPLSSQAAHRLVLDTEPYLLLRRLLRPRGRYVEALLANPRPPDRPAMGLHLAGCVACAEEARSLVELAAADAGTDPTPALAVLAG